MATTPALLAELKAIEAAATRGQDLTRQLLAMSRNQALNLRPLDVNMQLGQLTELARRIMPENINFDLVQGPALPVVEGDASQIDQVFMNLFINARNAMPQGGRLSVETKEVLVDGKFVELHPQAKPGRYVLCTVTDTGTGMAKDVLDHIFEPFFSASGKRAGTGLGLAVAYGVVQQHLGMIHCQSEVGLGTTFKVYLPVPEQVGSTVDARVEPAVVQGKEHVLVADDDDLVRGVLVRILERAGFQTTAVADGDSACDQAAKRTFDAYILDVVMPGLPCRDVVERIRGLRPGARILLSSGYTAESATTAFAREAGLDLINKPYDPDRLIRTIRRVIGERVPEPPPP
jgi:CheY-like chemotaxis protein